jgi:hypothetical protein
MDRGLRTKEKTKKRSNTELTKTVGELVFMKG